MSNTNSSSAAQDAATNRLHRPPPPMSASRTSAGAPAAAAAASSSAAAASPASAFVRRSYFRYPSLDHLVSGLAAGTVATLCLHPFDLIKTRMQVGGRGAALVGVPSSTVYRSSFHAASRLVRHEGWLALYKGLTPNLVGNTAAWGLYFFGFDVVKRAMSHREPLAVVQWVSNPTHLPQTAADGTPAADSHHRPHRHLNALEHILAASLTGTVVGALTNPIWVVKTRMFLDYTPQATTAASSTAAAAATAGSSSAALPLDAKLPKSAAVSGVVHQPPPGSFSYPSMISALRIIWSTEGFLGLYRGFVPGLLGVSHGAMQFMCYEELKRMRIAQRRAEAAPGQENQAASAPWTAGETIVMSIVSKAFASFTTYPYQTLRSRMQAGQGTHVPLRTVVAATWREEGVRGFYRGVWINLVKVMPAACTVFLVYEQVGGYMKRHATFPH